MANEITDNFPATTHNERTIRFINMDCDLYCSTKGVFHLFGNSVPKETVIVPDEYPVNTCCCHEELKTFRKAADQDGWSYENIAFSLPGKQDGCATYRQQNNSGAYHEDHGANNKHPGLY